MNKFIKVYNDIISPDLADVFEDLIVNAGIPFTYVSNITSKADVESKHLSYKNNKLISKYPGFSYLLMQNNNFPRELTLPYCFNFFQIPYQLCSKLNINLIDIIRARVFLQVPHIYEKKSGIHIDIIDDEDNPIPHWVCLYYVTDSDGDTILFEDDKKTEIKRITPKKGRIVFFDGLIPHCSVAPTKNHRIIVNFNFIGNQL